MTFLTALKLHGHLHADLELAEVRGTVPPQLHLPPPSHPSLRATSCAQRRRSRPGTWCWCRSWQEGW